MVMCPGREEMRLASWYERKQELVSAQLKCGVLYWPFFISYR
jgi:hypothetical protein